MRTPSGATLVAICSTALILAVHAERAGAQPASRPAPGFYLGLDTATQTREIGVDVNLGTAAEWARGFGMSGVFGYRTPVNVRIEFELSLLDNNNIGFYFPPYPNGPREQSAGHVSLTSFMVNGYYDVPLGQFAPGLRRVRPFIGVGIGPTVSRINGVTSQTLQAGIPGVFGPTVLDTASRFTQSWQTRLGATIEATDRLEVFGDWRHFETGQLNFKTIQFPDVQVTGANIDGFEGGIRVYLP